MKTKEGHEEAYDEELLSVFASVPSTFSSSNFRPFSPSLSLSVSLLNPCLSLSTPPIPSPFLTRLLSLLGGGNVGVDVGEVSLQGRRASTDPDVA